MIQGDLADPLYFDFISFCQYAVIANKMRRGKVDFIEKVAIADVNHNKNNNDNNNNDDAAAPADDSYENEYLLR